MSPVFALRATTGPSIVARRSFSGGGFAIRYSFSSSTFRRCYDRLYIHLSFFTYYTKKIVDRYFLSLFCSLV